jgi:hypothetical protein
MNILRTLSLAALAAAVVSPLLGMNNADVIKMKQADFSESTILMAIGKEPANYDTSPDALIEMKKAGVSETVIQKIVSVQAGENHSSAKSEDSSSSAPASSASAAKWAEQDFPSIAPPLINPVAGQEYFLRSSLHFEDGEYVGTNYSRGVLVPINTPVKIDAIKSDSISLHRIDTNDKLTVKNVEKYTLKTMAEYARLLFSDVQTPLERLPEDLAAEIRRGEMRKGMTKEQVLMTRGYPPAHETPSIDGDRWVYWSSRFVKLTIVFSNGRLSEGRGIY